MPSDVYEVLALGARYWFLLLGGIVVFGSYRWLFADRKERHTKLKMLPDAGMIGEFVVLEGSAELPENTRLPVPREGNLGYTRGCDIVVPCAGVSGVHADFVFDERYGLLVHPHRRRSCSINGVAMGHRDNPVAFAMHHGDELKIGDALLKLGVFYGLDDGSTSVDEGGAAL